VLSLIIVLHGYLPR